MPISTSGSSRHRHRSRSAAELRREEEPATPFDTAAEGLVYCLLAFSPFAFGVVAAWSREIFLALVAAAAGVVAVKHVAGAWAGRAAGYRWSWAYPTIVAFLTLCVLQTLPLPAAWVGRVSPGTVELRTELLHDLPNLAAALRRVPISFYVHRTVEQVVLVAAVAVVFAVVLDVFRDPARIRRLLTAVVAVGLGVAGLSAYQHLAGATKIYGVVPMAHPDVGPFMNYSHFSQFVNMSVGAALGLLLDRLATLADLYRSPGELWSAIRRPRNAVVWACAALGVLGPIMVLLSMSKMGMLSLFATALVTGGLLAWRGRSTALAAASGAMAWTLVGFALVVFAVLLFVRFDAVAAKLATVPTYENTDTRTEILRDLLPAYRRFPLVGTGLGTFEFVFGLYDHRNWPTMASHAENEYAQLMLETGVLGVLPAAAFVALLVTNYVRATRRPAVPIDYVPFGLGFGLLAILIHSGSDFGQHLPANAALTAAFAALLTTCARRQSVTPPATTTPMRRPLALVGTSSVLAGVVVAAVAVILWADRARAAESLWFAGQDRANELSAKQWQAGDAEYAAAVAPATAAVRLEPADVEYRYWADVYRWLALAHTVDPATGREVLPPGGHAVASRLVDDLHATRVLCPTYGYPSSLAGQIDRDVLGRVDQGRWEIATSARLAPYNASICMTAAAAALDAKRPDDATAILAHYLAIGGGVSDVAAACVRTGDALVAYRLVEHDRAGLLAFANRMPAGDPRWAAWIARCRSKADQLLAADAARPDAPPELAADQAAVDLQTGRPARAVDLYRKALIADFGNLDWHTGLARSLIAANRYAQAADEIRVCLRLHPDTPDLRDLLADCEAKAAHGPTTTR